MTTADEVRRARSFGASRAIGIALRAQALVGTPAERPKRLAEALAERMHELVRRELWGYATDEALSNDELIAERYQGIRPAPGYPATPDHLAKATLFELLDAEAQADIHLTESMAMLPTAAVSGIYLWHPESHYFGIGRMGADQLADYARRAGMPVEDSDDAVFFTMPWAINQVAALSADPAAALARVHDTALAVLGRAIARRHRLRAGHQRPEIRCGPRHRHAAPAGRGGGAVRRG